MKTLKDSEIAVVIVELDLSFYGSWHKRRVVTRFKFQKIREEE